MSKFCPQGDALGLYVIVISQSTRGQRRHMRGGCTAGATAHFCSLGMFTSAAPVTAGGGASQANQRAPISVARTKCDLSTWKSNAGPADGSIRSGYRRVAFLSWRRKHRHPTADSGFAKSGRRAFHWGRLIRTFNTYIWPQTSSHAPATLAFHVNRARRKGRIRLILGNNRTSSSRSAPSLRMAFCAMQATRAALRESLT